MTNLYSLLLSTSKIKGKLEFGIPNTSQEMDEMFRLRYDVYSRKDYIYIEKYPDKKEIDDFDTENKSTYFIAKFNGKVIGSIRMICDTPLPTQKAFKFNEPEFMSNIDNNKKCEFGRFVIIPPEKGIYLPRGLVMLFMIYTLNTYSLSKGFIGGYAFIKKSLLIKLNKFKFPIHIINDYSLTYKDGVLAKYFVQQNDPVIPIYYTSKEFNKYLDSRINNSWLFLKINKDSYILKSNLYTFFLKRLGII